MTCCWQLVRKSFYLLSDSLTVICMEVGKKTIRIHGQLAVTHACGRSANSNLSVARFQTSLRVTELKLADTPFWAKNLDLVLILRIRATCASFIYLRNDGVYVIEAKTRTTRFAFTRAHLLNWLSWSRFCSYGEPLSITIKLFGFVSTI